MKAIPGAEALAHRRRMHAEDRWPSLSRSTKEMCQQAPVENKFLLTMLSL